jgi:hypothetical protein
MPLTSIVWCADEDCRLSAIRFAGLPPLAPARSETTLSE